MQENIPYLISVLPLENDFKQFQKIKLASDEITIGRGRSNTIILPLISVSRNHCIIRKIHDNWTIEDLSSFGIDINGSKLGKGNTKKLQNGDLIILEPTESLIFKYWHNDTDDSQPETKRMKLDPDINKDFINDMKIKFEESQNDEMRHIAEKIYNTQQRQSATIQLKEQLSIEYQKKLEHLEYDFALQIHNLKGEKHEVEGRKAALEMEKDMHLALVKQEMESKIISLMNQINQQNEIESELQIENKLLKEKLHKEREEFLAELNRENSSKQEMLRKLEARIKEQEEIRLKEKQELEEQLRIETEQLRLIKENELKELAEQKIRREEELLQELNYMRQNLEGQVEQMELQRCQAEEQLISQMKEMKKINEEDQEKMKQLILERQTIENKLYEAQQKSEIELKKLRTRVSEREVELAALAAERIQQQAELSSEVINSLQTQLEKVKTQLESVENEKKELLANIPNTSNIGESSSKQRALAEVGELMESELQCSICAELFVSAITLNCSHTFCKYCITVWKRKKKECPICRTQIVSECKSLVLDSFIDKMVQNLSEDVKLKRLELIKSREVVKKKASSSRTVTARTSSVQTPRRGRNRRTTTSTPTPTSTITPMVDLTGIPNRYSTEHSRHAFEMLFWGLDENTRSEIFGPMQGPTRPRRRDRSANATLSNAPSTSNNVDLVEIIDDN